MKPSRLYVMAALILAAASPALRGSTGTATVGQAVAITVTCDGTPPLTYQWKKNGVNIQGATNYEFDIAAVQLSDAAAYTVQVSNSAGSILSDTATLTVTALPPTKGTTAIKVGATTSSLARPVALTIAAQ